MATLVSLQHLAMPYKVKKECRKQRLAPYIQAFISRREQAFSCSVAEVGRLCRFITASVEAGLRPGKGLGD